MLLADLAVPAAAATTDVAARLGLDLLAVFLLIRGVYYRTYRRAHLFLTFFSVNLIIFLVTYALNQVDLTLGAAFGLFAVFSMLRYRTEGISANDMTYLFLVIAIGLLMAIGGGSLLGLAALGTLVLLVTLLLESGVLAKREVAQRVVYDDIKLIHVSERDALIADLARRTGLPVHRVDVKEVDFLRETAQVTLYYHAES
jgi:hypothetical protein